MQSEALSCVPSDGEAWRDITSRANEVRDKLTGATNALLKQINFINLDISIGRLGPADLHQINAKLKSVMFRAAYVHLSIPLPYNLCSGQRVKFFPNFSE